MQENGKEKRIHPAVRVLALILALIVIGGSIFVLTNPQGGNAGASLPGIFSARAESEGWKTLKKGSSGADVKKAQEALRQLGYYDGKADGNFSRVFEEAVMAFQEDFGLEKTGRIDLDTYEMITWGLEEADLVQAPEQKAPTATAPPEEEAPFVLEGEPYSDKEHVAAYLRAFGELPVNYLTKQQARDLGWDNSLGNLWQVAPGMSIGGDRFGNYEGQLPREKGRQYYECDIDFDGGYRNGKRIIFSSDGLIFYTEDHYNTFEDITEEGIEP